MGQRLAFGMALVGDPDLLVLDEPSSGLDPVGMQEMRQTIRELAADGTTVFFSSHILSEVDAICDRVGIMSDGQLVALDDIETLREELGGTARITVTLDSPPAELGLERLAWVENVAIDGRRVHVDCHGPSRKVDVITHLTERATITDIVSEANSMEELFNSYTGDTTDDERQRPAEVPA